MSGAWGWALLVFAAAALATALVTRLVLAGLRRRAILDHPNERSSHALPTPRGGGIAVIAVLIPSWILLHRFDAGSGMSLWLAIAGILALAVLSWLDDLHGLSAGLRIVCHGLVVAIVLASLPAGDLVFQGLLPPLADHVAAGLLWLWFINLFNFMDGIDGITGVEAIAIALGLALLAALSNDLALRADTPFAVALAGTAAGFLVWNWHPARLFLGDVGSVPLGFALGWLLLHAAIAGYWAAAVILPLYYLADATITLGRRALRGAKIWQAHREHFYQRAVAQGRGHDAVVAAIAIGNLVLIGCALIAEATGGAIKLLAIAAAALAVALLLAHLAGLGRTPRVRP
jgi:UDP-N-acetylmuramyl pentapeptide phosphotransferase/UDP-N-acetylglucosamine-1-phosphate transferase